MKPIEWIGSSLEAVRGFPEIARQQVGYQLYRVQTGIDPSDWKPMNTVGANVREIRIHVRDEYRLIYVATFEEAVYVLHAFQKKTRKTTKRDLSLATSRLAVVIKKEKEKTMKSKPSKNVFRDLGFTAEEADNLRIRSALMIEITEHIQQAELTQKAAAQLLGVAQPRISDITRGRIEVFSIDTLIAMLSRLGVKTSIRVGNKRVA